MADQVYRSEIQGEGEGLGGEPPGLLSASLEDYLEAILQLERTFRVARVSEIADQLSVSRPSVTGALKSLAARGLISHERYGHVTLTAQGKGIALAVERRHLAIRDFLTEELGVSRDKAEITACRLEHVLDQEVLERLLSYAEKHGVPQRRGKENKESSDGVASRSAS